MNPRGERRGLWWAVVASLFVHVIVALSLAAFNSAFVPAPVPEEKPIELTLVDLTPAPPPVPPAMPAYVEKENESPTAPKEKTFESHADSIAASNRPASGDAPLPSQEGEERPFMDLKTQQSVLPSPEMAAQPAQTPPPSAPTPAPTPTPEPAATPGPSQLAMLTATPPPPLQDPTEAEPSPTPEETPPVTPPEVRPMPERPSAAFQAEKQETKVSGSISNRGPSSVDAVATPLGKYKKTVSDAIGARWYHHLKSRHDLASIGTARVLAEVDEQGDIQNLRLISNTANESFANICLQSFQEAQIPPIPSDLLPTLPEQRLTVEISFTYFAN